MNYRSSVREQTSLQVVSRFPGGENLNPGFGDTVVEVRAKLGKTIKAWRTDSKVSSN